MLAQEVYSGANLIKPVPGQSSPQYLPTLLQASNLVIGAPENQWTMQPAATLDNNGNPQSVPFGIPAAAAGTPGGGTTGGGTTGGGTTGGGTTGGGTAGGTGGGTAGGTGGGTAGGTGGGTAGGTGGGTAGGTGGGGAGGGAADAQPAGGPDDLSYLGDQGKKPDDLSYLGDQGKKPDDLSYLGDQGKKTGIYALLKADIFNILCLPVDPAMTFDSEVLEAAATFCQDQRAMLIVDPPSKWATIPLDFGTINTYPPLKTPSPNAAVYYPNLKLTDETGANFNAGPCGAVAGVWAATDNSRGVWKAPAGTAATITGISGFTAQVDDGESGIINPLAVNGLRTMPLVGSVVWGARTTVGADQAPNQWKYIPVRRVALYIEESLRRGIQWTVFEPNAEPLWSSLRLNVTTFMQGLFRQGAFAGTTADQAYLVQCDASNNPPDLVAQGIVSILVGFAPLYPAEFVIINIQQQALQAST